MIECSFRVTHEGCWTEEWHKQFPRASATIIYSYRVSNQSITMLEVRNVSNPESLVGWLESHEVIISSHLLKFEENEDLAYISLAGEYNGDTVPVLDVLLRNHTFPTVPAVAVEGWEHWSVITSDHEILSTTYSELRELGSVEIDSVRNGDINRLLTGLSEIKQALHNLTPRQEEVLCKAIEFNYYESPRKCNLNDISQKDSANISTVGEHLRVAESKLLKSVYPLLTKHEKESQ